MTFGDILLKNFGGSCCKSINGLVLLCSPPLHRADQDIFDILNTQSGFGAISGVADSRDLEDLYFEGKSEKANLAVEMFCYKIAKTMASYFVPLGM